MVILQRAEKFLTFNFLCLLYEGEMVLYQEYWYWKEIFPTVNKRSVQKDPRQYYTTKLEVERRQVQIRRGEDFEDSARD